MASLAHDWIAGKCMRYYQSPSPSLSPNPIGGSKYRKVSSSSSSNRCGGVKIRSEQAPKARFVARRQETVEVKQQQQRPLLEYMKLPASQYSVLDAERIERVDDNTFRCFVYRFSFFSFEVCPVLLLRVSPHPLGTSIHLLSCHLEGSPFVVAQNHKFQASMVNHISCHSGSDSDSDSGPIQHLSSDALIQVTIDIPFPFRAFPVHAIESSGTRVLEQLLALMLPRFMQQLVKDYEAWASGDTSRQPLGTGQI
ncbi:hypothetical protein vseg_007628 [Gypsophila vaccaria]